jgi:hypothetical protein
MAAMADPGARLDKRTLAALADFSLGDAGCIYVERLDDGTFRAWSDEY